MGKVLGCTQGLQCCIPIKDQIEKNKDLTGLVLGIILALAVVATCYFCYSKLFEPRWFQIFDNADPRCLLNYLVEPTLRILCVASPLLAAIPALIIDHYAIRLGSKKNQDKRVITSSSVVCSKKS